jgi:hypothetical protein
MEAIDYGIDTDHVSAKISVLGTVEEITEFRIAMPVVSSRLNATFSKGEKPFGPVFNCETSNEYLLIDIDDMETTDKGIAQMSFQLAASTIPPWAYREIEFNLANFAVQSVKRESKENKSVSQTEADWSAHRHGWSKPEFTLSLLANSEVMGGTIRWLMETKRHNSFSFACNNSMMLVSQQSENARCLSFGNLRRLGNSNFWQADFDFVRVA